MAVLLSIVTAHLVVGDLRRLHGRVASLGPLDTVVVAARPLPLGTRLSDGDLREVRRHRGDTARDALHSQHAALGRVLALGVVAGAELTETHLLARGTSPSALVDPDTRLLHLDVDDPDPPGPGTVVDVVSAADDITARVVAAGAVVVAGGSASADASVDALTAPATSVTTTTTVAVLVRRADVPAVASALALGAVLLAIAPLEEACCRS